MPIFRIFMALAIVSIIMPEVLKAPVRYVAGLASDLVGEAPMSAQEIAARLAKLCAEAPEACTAAARAVIRQKNPSLPETAP